MSFNPLEVAEYRLIGYEIRILNREDFNDDTKDAGEISAGHQVTALYELVPVGVTNDAGTPDVTPSPFVDPAKPNKVAETGEIMRVARRYKRPNENESTLLEHPLFEGDGEFASADDDFKFAAAVAGFGMKLRRSQFAGSWTLSDVLVTAKNSAGEDEFGFRAEFIDLVQKASSRMGEE